MFQINVYPSPPLKSCFTLSAPKAALFSAGILAATTPQSRAVVASLLADILDSGKYSVETIAKLIISTVQNKEGSCNIVRISRQFQRLRYGSSSTDHTNASGENSPQFSSHAPWHLVPPSLSYTEHSAPYYILPRGLGPLVYPTHSNRAPNNYYPQRSVKNLSFTT